MFENIVKAVYSFVCKINDFVWARWPCSRVADLTDGVEDLLYERYYDIVA